MYRERKAFEGAFHGLCRLQVFLLESGRRWLAILFNNYNSGMKLTTIHKYIIKIFIVNIIIILVTRHESSFARIVSITITMSVEFCIMYVFTNFIE